MKLIFKIIFCFSILFLANPTIGKAQDIELKGYWEGKITQYEGGYRSDYTFELYLKQKGESVTGRSYVYVDDIYAVMNVEGQIHSGGLILNLKDVEIVDDKVHQGMEWCIKSYYLVYNVEGDNIELKGSWRGNTSFTSCVPGKIQLTKVAPEP